MYIAQLFASLQTSPSGTVGTLMYSRTYICAQLCQPGQTLRSMNLCHAELPQPGPGDWIHEITKGGSMWVPKNTKVRATFREVLHNVHGFELPEASEEDDSNKMCNAEIVTDTADSHPSCLPEGAS
jgi:hypothetical protein